MPRIPKPYLHKGWYRTNTGGVQGYKLCRIEDGLSKAARALQALMGKLSLAREDVGSPRPVGVGIRAGASVYHLVGDLHDEFLDMKKTECEPATYQHYVGKLKRFLA